MEAKRLTGPLFWLHGDESKERLEMYLGKVAESGNGCFTAESRPHTDWLGEGWYRDLDICLQAAKKHDLKMWIFDERVWPSQGVGGKVPARYAAKRLAADAILADGPTPVQAAGHGGERYIATLAGKLNAEGKIESESLIDLHEFIKDGKLSWQAPAGKWQVMKFTHTQAPGLGTSDQLSVDGASRDCTDWFIQTVYQPHFDRFGADFGKTIPGFSMMSRRPRAIGGPSSMPPSRNGILIGKRPMSPTSSASPASPTSPLATSIWTLSRKPGAA